MRVVLQRVREAEVTVDGESIGRIDHGLVLLAGLAAEDDDAAVVWMARKIVGLRIFAEGRQDVLEAGAAILAVSQFTLLADCRKGRRPSYDAAMPAAEAGGLFDRFVAELRHVVPNVAIGRFGAMMAVRLVNDGPFTLILESPPRARGGCGQNSDYPRRRTT